MISADQIISSLKPYKVQAAPPLAESIRRYVEILERWNQRIALTTVKNADEMLRFHFGESLFALLAVPITHGRLADVGTGAGFPGMALALFCPALKVELIESNLKKAAFLNEVVRELGLKNVIVLSQRMEDICNRDPYEFVCARALGNYPEFLKWAKKNLCPDGKAVLWLGAKDAEEISRDNDFVWLDKIEIPGSKQRILLVGSAKS